MNKELLPLGTVVLLKEAKRNIVIIGYSMFEHGTNKVWDYLGCAYPIGVVNSDTNLLFDAVQIDKVIFKGFSDQEGDEYREKIQLSIGDDV